MDTIQGNEGIYINLPERSNIEEKILRIIARLVDKWAIQIRGDSVKLLLPK